MRVLQINVLGPFEARLGDADDLAFESVKARALLVYLAVESGRQHSRETVASMLWPDRPDSAALANLRHTLASLRKTLGEQLKQQDDSSYPFFDNTPNTIQFKLTKRSRVDLFEFEKRLTVAENEQEEELQANIALLSEAVQLYRGRFMEGFSVRGCPEFEDWMLLRRENTSLKLQKVLRSLSNAHEATGAWEQSLSALRKLLQYEPWDEGAHRKVMVLLASHDQRSAALAQYERCRKLLWDELGVEPGEETLNLYEQIRAGKFSDLGVKEKSGAINRDKGVPEIMPLSERPPRSRFVSRTAELDRLHQALKQVLHGQGRMVFIRGEAGSGKTSLAWEFAHQAMAQYGDLLTVAGRCHGFSGLEDPFQPFREILQMLVSGSELQPGNYLAPEHLRRLTMAFPETIKSLLTVGPDLIGSFIPKETLIERIETFSPGKHHWQRKFKEIIEQDADHISTAFVAANSTSSALAHNPEDTVTRMLIELAHYRPIVLFIDDLQWADIGTVSLLHYLCKRLASSRIFILGAYRPQDVAFGRRESRLPLDRHPFERVRLELKREFGEIEIDLEQAEGMDLVEALVDIVPNRLGMDFRHTLYHHTNGNPLFTVELLHSMHESGHLVYDSSGQWVEGVEVDWEQIPARVEAVIAERIGRLPAALQELLRVASVEGEIFTAEVAARVFRFEEQQVVSWLSGPLSREQQIVNALNVARASSSDFSTPSRLSRYRFRHLLFQKYLYNSLDPVERSALHEATGLALETLYGPAASDMALHLAWHFEQAGLLARAAEYLLIAGKQALNMIAHSQAKAFYDRSLELIQQLPQSPERNRLEIQVQLARGAPLLATEGWGSQKAVEAVKRAVELLEQTGGNSPDSSILLALYFQADHFNAQNNMPEALARVELLLQQLSPASEDRYKVLAYMVAGQCYLFAGQPVTGAEYLEKAISCYHLEDHPFLTGVVGHNVQYTCQMWNALALWILGSVGRARALSLQVIDNARKQTHPYYLSNTLSIAGAVFYAIQNDVEQAGAYAQECLRLPESDHYRMGRILSETVQGWVLAKRGEYDTGLALLQKGINEWKTTGALTILPVTLILLADALSLAGKTEAGLNIIATVLEMIQRTGRRIFESHVHWLRGEILIRGLRRAGPEWKPDLSPAACFEQAISIACRQQAKSLELRATISLARLLNEDGQAGEAARRLQGILEEFDEREVTHDLREAKELLAELHAAGELQSSHLIDSTEMGDSGPPLSVS